MSRLVRLFSACTVSTIALGALAGCGVGTLAPSSGEPVTNIKAGTLAGRSMGGGMPIIGATITAYTTSQTAYGTATAQQVAGPVDTANYVGSGSTDENGAFTFAGNYNCPSNSFLYLVSAGGNTGTSGTLNPATATSTLSGSGVGSITLSNSGGSGYALVPTVTITPTDSNGSGATATATVAGGVVTGFAITNAGSGYDAAPTVTISNPRTGAANAAAVNVALLGSCASVFSTTSGPGNYTPTSPVVINELTSVAAAYALGNFTTVNGSGSSTTVYIGADASNSASSGSTTTAAGLAHAFANAANLVNINTATSANATLPGNSSAIVPQQVIDTLGNIIVACVNSAGTGTACNNLFTYTTPSGGSAPTTTYQALVNLAANPTLSGSTTNVGNLFNVATSQTNAYSPALTSATGLNDFSIGIVYPAGFGAGGVTYFALTNGGSGYSAAPTITLTGGGGSGATATAVMSGTSPNEVVSYLVVTNPGSGYTSAPTVGFSSGSAAATATIYATTNCVAGTCQGLLYPFSGALDVNDNFYVANVETYYGSSGTTTSNAISFSNNGTFESALTNNTGFKYANSLSLDSVGNAYFANGSQSGSHAVEQFTYTSSTGKLADSTTAANTTSGVNNNNQKTYALAIDKSNNVWAWSAAGLYKSSAIGSSLAFGSTNYNALTATFDNNYSKLIFDPDQNIWMIYCSASCTTSNQTVAVVPNTGSLGTPAYSTSGQVTATLGESYLTGIAFTGAAGSNVAYLSAVVGSPGIEYFSPTFGTGCATSSANGTCQLTALNVNTTNANSAASSDGPITATNIGGSYYSEADGGGSVWLPDFGSESVIKFNGGSTPTAYKYQPCAGGGSAVTTCTSVFAPNGVAEQIFTVSIDSTGSIWTTVSPNGTASYVGEVVEIIGAAAPTWPLLSLGLSGQKP